jgi:hypothetical protein
MIWPTVSELSLYWGGGGGGGVEECFSATMHNNSHEKGDYSSMLPQSFGRFLNP